MLREKERKGERDRQEIEIDGYARAIACVQPTVVKLWLSKSERERYRER